MKIMDGLHAFLWRDPTNNNCNTYLIDGDQRILIDPGHRHLFKHVEMELREVGLSSADIDLVIVTHAHPDHMEAVEMFAKPTLFAMGLAEMDFLRDMAERYRRDLGVPEPDFFLQEGELKVGRNNFQVVPAPGHSPGSICLYWPGQKVLFTGDVVFNQGIGRTDLPGGNGKTGQGFKRHRSNPPSLGRDLLRYHAEKKGNRSHKMEFTGKPSSWLIRWTALSGVQSSVRV